MILYKIQIFPHKRQKRKSRVQNREDEEETLFTGVKREAS